MPQAVQATRSTGKTKIVAARSCHGSQSLGGRRPTTLPLHHALHALFLPPVYRGGAIRIGWDPSMLVMVGAHPATLYPHPSRLPASALVLGEGDALRLSAHRAARASACIPQRPSARAGAVQRWPE